MNPTDAKLQEALAGRRPLRLFRVSHYLPSLLRQASREGFDGALLDMDQTPLSVEQGRRMLESCRLYHLAALPIRSLADVVARDGAWISPLPAVVVSRAGAPSGRLPDARHKSSKDKGEGDLFQVSGEHAEPIHCGRIVQIDSLETVQTLELWAERPEVSGFWIATDRLMLELGRVGNAGWTPRQVESRVAQASARHGKGWGGLAASASHLAGMLEQGATLVAYGDDLAAVAEMPRQWSQAWKLAMDSAGF